MRLLYNALSPPAPHRTAPHRTVFARPSGRGVADEHAEPAVLGTDIVQHVHRTIEKKAPVSASVIQVRSLAEVDLLSCFSFDSRSGGIRVSYSVQSTTERRFRSPLYHEQRDHISPKRTKIPKQVLPGTYQVYLLY